jgi:hypothetical protein
MTMMLTGVLAMVLSGLPAVLTAQDAPKTVVEKARAAAIEQAKKVVNEKLAVPRSDLAVESATAATWPSAALGCPEKGEMYAQVVTEGFRVLLVGKEKEKRYEVHVAGARAALCTPRPGPKQTR